MKIMPLYEDDSSNMPMVVRVHRSLGAADRNYGENASKGY